MENNIASLTAPQDRKLIQTNFIVLSPQQVYIAMHQSLYAALYKVMQILSVMIVHYLFYISILIDTCFY